MKLTEYKVQLTVTVNTYVIEHDSLETLIDEMKKRITSQLVGHRTNKRLGDTITISSNVVSEESKEI